MRHLWNQPFQLASYLLSSFLVSSGVGADTIHVDANLTSGANNGTSWGNALQGSAGLQTAIGLAVSGDQIFVAQGVYLPDSSSRDASFTLASNVEIYGSFEGGESSPAQRPAAGPFGSSASVLQGDLAGDDANGMFIDNSYHVVRADGVNSNAVLDGFVIQGGNADGEIGTEEDSGAGLLCLNSSPSFIQCYWLDNQSSFLGGGGYFEGGSGQFIACVFESNTAASAGGGLFLTDAGSSRLDRSQFLQNSAGRGGALQIFATSGAVVTNSVFADNEGTAETGGALWVSASDPQISNCTIVGNRSLATSVGGIRVVLGADPTVANCILWGNEGQDGSQLGANQVTPGSNVRYSIVEGGFAGTGNLAAEPFFVDAANFDFALTAGSAGIDAGNNALVPFGLLLDLALNLRFVDDPNVADTGVGAAPIVDMGALEFFEDPPVLLYCTPKASSAGCVATVLTSNLAAGPVSGANDYIVAALGVQGFKTGVLFAGFTGPANIPFSGGILCTTPPLKRGTVQTSLGSSPNACDGVYSTFVNDGAVVPSGLDAGPGGTAWYQYWYRDPANGPGNLGTALSNAAEISFQ